MYNAKKMLAWSRANKTSGVLIPFPRPFPRVGIELLHFKMLEKYLFRSKDEVEFTWLALCEDFTTSARSMEMAANRENQGYNLHWYAMGASSSGKIYASRFTIGDPINGNCMKFDATRNFNIPSTHTTLLYPISSYLDLVSEGSYGRLVGSRNMVNKIDYLLNDLYSGREERDERKF